MSMRWYLREKGIPVIYGDFLGYQETTGSLVDELNGRRGSEYWTPREYSCDPDYSNIDTELFQYLEQGGEKINGFR